MELVALCARPSLAPKHIARLDVLLDEDLDWAHVLDRTRIHGVVGMGYHHLAQQAEGRIPDDMLRTLETVSRRAQADNFRAVQELIRLADLFSEAGVPLLTFKGPLLAQKYYGNLAFRQFGDVDLLVKRADLGRARTLLEAQGYQVARSLTDAEIERRHQAQLGLEFTHEETGVVVELHWALLNRTFSFSLAPSALWPRARTVPLGTASIQALAPADLLLYLCAHGTKHHWSRLLCACDVAQVLRAHPGLVDEDLLARARRTGSLRILLLGLQLTERWLGETIPGPARAALAADSSVQPLVHEIEDRWFGTRAGIHSPANRATLWFFLRTRERIRDNWAMMRHYGHLALAPTEKDRGAVPACLPAPGQGLAPYFVRPIRLLGRGLARLRSALPGRWGAVTEAGARPSLVRRARRLVSALRRRTWAERRDLAVALGAAGLVIGLLHTCSFRRVVELVERGAHPTETTGAPTDAEERRLMAAVEAVSRRLLPTRPCLTQALTARLLLGRRGARPTELRIGVAPGSDGQIKAHAWLERDGTVLTGGRASPAVYVPLTSSRENETRGPLHPASPVPDS
jgi:hypothetical protein